MDSGFPRCFSGNPAGAHCAHSRSSFTKSFIYMEKVPAQKAFGIGLLRIQFRGDFLYQNFLDLPPKISYTKLEKYIGWMKIPGETAHLRRRRGYAENSQAKGTGIRQNSEKPYACRSSGQQAAPKKQSRFGRIFQVV